MSHSHLVSGNDNKNVEQTNDDDDDDDDDDEDDDDGGDEHDIGGGGDNDVLSSSQDVAELRVEGHQSAEALITCVAPTDDQKLLAEKSPEELYLQQASYLIL